MWTTVEAEVQAILCFLVIRGFQQKWAQILGFWFSNVEC
jgi:hypothetical protein